MFVRISNGEKALWENWRRFHGEAAHVWWELYSKNPRNEMYSGTYWKNALMNFSQNLVLLNATKCLKVAITKMPELFLCVKAKSITESWLLNFER